MDAIASLDSLIKAIYLMYKSDPQFLSQSFEASKDSNYSKSIFTLFDVFFRYLSKVERLKWTDKLQNAKKQIDNADENTDWKLIRDDINKFKHWVAKIHETGGIPQYDLKNITSTIDSWVISLDDKKRSFNKKKFRFSYKPSRDNRLSYVESSQSSTFGTPTICGKDGIECVIEKTHQGVFLSEIKNSIIVIPADMVAGAVTMNNCRGSLFVIHSESFLYAEELRNCIIIGRAHQMRLHKSKGVYLDIQIESTVNKIIIEESTSIKFVDGRNVEIDDFSEPSKKPVNYTMVDKLVNEAAVAETQLESLSSLLKSII
ncbi:hypothetical protein KL929_000436 [Ogataea haglerorum]|nr:hypothetical protein KL929_000436 [Ogataea haglerorum]